MPTPWVPPDPDIPRPIRWDPDRSFTAFPIRLVGMAPHDEQIDHRFTLDGLPLGAMMLYEENAAKYAYVGVALGDLASLAGREKGVFEGRYLPLDEARRISAALDAGEHEARVVDVDRRWTCGGAVLRVTAKVTKPSDHPRFVYAVPFAPVMKQRFPEFAQYRAQAGWAKLPTRGGTVEVKVPAKPGAVYGVFVGTTPSDGFEIHSPAVRHDLA